MRSGLRPPTGHVLRTRRLTKTLCVDGTMRKLTEEQAYLAMYSFLSDYYDTTNSDEIGGLLGSMSLLEDGDREAEGSKLLGKIIERAHNNGKVKELWEALTAPNSDC